MNQTQFKVGDRVMVNRAANTHHGKRGYVTSIVTGNGLLVSVELEGFTYSIRFFAEELAPAEKFTLTVGGVTLDTSLLPPTPTDPAERAKMRAAAARERRSNYHATDAGKRR